MGTERVEEIEFDKWEKEKGEGEEGWEREKVGEGKIWGIVQFKTIPLKCLALDPC